MVDKPTTNPLFATGGAAKLSEPDGFRSGGYPFKKVWAANEANWQFNTIGEYVNWLQLSAGRYEFPWDLDDAAVTYGDGSTPVTGLVNTYQNAGFAELATSFTYDLLTPLGGFAIEAALVDGRHVWTLDGDGILTQWNIDELIDSQTFFAQFTIGVSGFAPNMRAIAGQHLAFYRTGDTELFIFDIGTGSTSTVTMPGNIQAIVSCFDGSFITGFAVAHDVGGSGETFTIVDAGGGGIVGSRALGVPGVGIDFDPRSGLIVGTDQSGQVHIATPDETAADTSQAIPTVSANYTAANRNVGWSQGRAIVASGESTTSSLYVFDRHGVERELVEVNLPSGPASVVSTFGRVIVTEVGSSDTRLLNERLFGVSDSAVLGDLEFWDDGQNIWRWNSTDLIRIPLLRPIVPWRANWSNGNEPLLDLHVQPTER